MEYEPVKWDHVVTCMSCKSTVQVDSFDSFCTICGQRILIMNNDGIKYDQDKPRYSLLDPEFTEGIVKVLTEGAKTYGDYNWQKVEPFTDRYVSALERHIAAWRKGERLDKDTGLSHLYHAACNLYFLDWKDRQDG